MFHQMGRRVIVHTTSQFSNSLHDGADAFKGLVDRLISRLYQGYLLQIETLEDGYPEWHPTPYSLHGMPKLFVYLEVTGDSYRSLARHPELAIDYAPVLIAGECVELVRSALIPPD